MKIHCANGWLFHEWKNNQCDRCGVTYRGTLTDVTWGDDPSLFGVPVPDPLVGPASRRGSVRPLLRLVRVHRDEHDSSSANAACDPASSEGS
jgi:hypothetical protein